jgi:hypothetical protein
MILQKYQVVYSSPQTIKIFKKYLFWQNIPIIPLLRVIFQLKIIKNSKKFKKKFKIQKINNLKFISYSLFFIFIFILKKKTNGCSGWRYFLTTTDTPPVTIRLQRRDDRFYSPARRVPIRNHQLTNLCRGQVHPAMKNIFHLRKKLVILDPHVAIGQRFECQKITDREMDMNINEQAHSRRNRSKSSTTIINLLVVCNKTKFRLESFITFEISIS